ncbi:hypothetical protein [Roseibium sp.]|uniref:hypothetical protein n=1 Tax=Roseibium sp. TaxID=1936156 RepID=UPI0039F12948
MSDDNINLGVRQLQDKVELNELRARDAEARLRIIEAEIAIANKRKELLELVDDQEK